MGDLLFYFCLSTSSFCSYLLLGNWYPSGKQCSLGSSRVYWGWTTSCNCWYSWWDLKNGLKESWCFGWWKRLNLWVNVLQTAQAFRTSYAAAIASDWEKMKEDVSGLLRGIMMLRKVRGSCNKTTVDTFLISGYGLSGYGVSWSAFWQMGAKQCSKQC